MGATVWLLRYRDRKENSIKLGHRGRSKEGVGLVHGARLGESEGVPEELGDVQADARGTHKVQEGLQGRPKVPTAPQGRRQR